MAVKLMFAESLLAISVLQLTGQCMYSLLLGRPT